MKKIKFDVIFGDDFKIFESKVILSLLKNNGKKPKDTEIKNILKDIKDKK